MATGYLDLEKLLAIPEKKHAEFEFAFFLHDQLLHLLQEADSYGIRSAQFGIDEETAAKLKDDSNDFFDIMLASPARSQVSIALVNHIIVALMSDMMNFMYEGLIALSKRKFAVAFSNLRKVYREHLLFLSSILASESEFFEKFEENPAVHMDSSRVNLEMKREIIEQAINSIMINYPSSADTIVSSAFDISDPYSMASLFDKSVHLVTRNRKVQTEPLNLNFIFKDPRDNDSFETLKEISYLNLYLLIVCASLYKRVLDVDKANLETITFRSLLIYEALYVKGKTHLSEIVVRPMQKLSQCTVCENELKFYKKDTPRLALVDRIVCRTCGADIAFPFSWLLGKIKISFDEVET